MKTYILNFFRLFFKIKFFEEIICFYTQGKDLNSLIARIPANYYQYPIPSIRKVKRDGICFELDISDYMEWLVYFGIVAEPRDKLYDLVQKGYYIIDVGSNFGETTLNFAKLTGTTGKVFSFEPDTYCFNKLKSNISLNKFSNIQIFNIGLGSSDAEYYLSSENIHNRGENKIQINSPMQPNIKVKKLDDIMDSYQIKKVDLIKIDVEGFEYDVLRGASNTIMKHRPIMFIEVNDNNLRTYNSSAPCLMQFLKKYYTKIIHAETGEPIHETSSFKDKHFDIIVYP